MTLYLVATPIGNLEDLSPRAARVIKEAALVACEDTRRTQHLLAHLGLRKAVTRYDEHVHPREAPRLLEHLRRGEDVALVTDAGTPSVSDPGQRLVEAALAAGIAVVPIPGPSAVLAALAGSGLPTDQFVFLGFLPRRPGRIKKEFEKAGSGRTLVFFESPFRVKDTLVLAREVFGDCPACVARELTKMHEEFVRGPLGQVLDNLAKRKDIKGEITVVLAPQSTAAKEG